jgi:AraC-like DNA-binding protein
MCNDFFEALDRALVRGILHKRNVETSRQELSGYSNRFERIAQEDLGGRTKIADFCVAAGTNRQTLLRAFKTIRGVTPSNYLREARLAQARQALLSAHLVPESVTQVAMRFGFRELGRFAVEYRAAFGEKPSDTLRRTAAKRPAPPNSANIAAISGPAGFDRRTMISRARNAPPDRRRSRGPPRASQSRRGSPCCRRLPANRASAA